MLTLWKTSQTNMGRKRKFKAFLSAFIAVEEALVSVFTKDMMY